MNRKSFYRKVYSRDCSLVIVELWWRAEAINGKKLTGKRHPFLPYIIFSRTGGIVEVFYSRSGMNWHEKTLVSCAKKDKKFLRIIEKNYCTRVKRISSCIHKEALTHDQLNIFFKDLKEMWVWYDAAWWFWELPRNQSDGLVLPTGFSTLRKNTQDVIMNAEKMILSSLKKLYPKVSSLVDVLLIEEIINNNIPGKKELRNRKDRYFFTDNQLFVDLSKSDIEKKYSMHFEDIRLPTETKQIKGQSASLGNEVIGTVKIVLTWESLSKVKAGDILVSTMTQPDFVPAMRRAAAIVTDEGGTLCHAAIVSRELNKPCIVATKIATKILKDGDIVEVDANSGIIKILK